MKNKIAVLAMLVASVVTIPAHAISASYRAKLERSGCTQVTEADGSCDVHKTKAQNAKGKTFAAEADHVLNKPISTSAEYLLSKGWLPNNGLWKKQGYTLSLEVKDETVVNTQLSKG